MKLITDLRELKAKTKSARRLLKKLGDIEPVNENMELQLMKSEQERF